MTSNRTAAVVLAAAAVVGVAGGSTAAVLQLDRGTASPSVAAASDPATAPGDPTVPFWATPGEIHDGDRVVPIRTNLEAELSSLMRIEDGWLLTVRHPRPHVPYTAYVVRPDGEVTRLLDLAGRGDVNGDGSELVALVMDEDGGRQYQTWSTETFETTATITAQDVEVGSDEPSGAAAFAGDHVLTTWRGEGGTRVVDLDPGTGGHREVAAGVQEWTTSEDGETVLANVANEEPFTDIGTCALLRSPGTPEGITDCRSRFFGRPALSPSQRRTLTVDSRTDGFGPGGFEVVRVRGAEVVGTLLTPGPTLDGRLLGEDEVLVLAARNLSGRGTVVSVCDLAGACEEVFRSDDSGAVLGST